MLAAGEVGALFFEVERAGTAGAAQIHLDLARDVGLDVEGLHVLQGGHALGQDLLGIGQRGSCRRRAVACADDDHGCRRKKKEAAEHGQTVLQ